MQAPSEWHQSRPPESSILNGIRVLEVSTGMAGSVASMFLAEAGAEVIKVEPPSGDPLRGSGAFATWNRSKRSIALELDEARDRETFEHLLQGADVLIHSLDRHDTAALALDEKTMHTRAPSVIVCQVASFPTGHPDQERTAGDFLVQASSGLMAEVATRRPGPTFLRLPLPSWGAAYLSCIGVLVRLYDRERFGRIGPVETSLYQGALFFLNSVWKDAEKPSAGLRDKAGLARRPHPWMFQCADGKWIQPFVTFVQSVPFLETVYTLGYELPEIGPEPSEEELEVLRAVFRSRTSEEWVQALWEHDVDCEVMLRLGELYRSPLAQDAGATVDVEDPVFGWTRQAAVPFVTDPAPQVVNPAPGLDQDGREIRRSGWRQSQTARARGARVEDAALPQAPLAGLRVLDLGAWISAPLCASLLGDLGADVVKIEPLAGDPSRSGDIFYLAGNRAKRSIALDLRQPASHSVLHRLIGAADVVVHNVRQSKARQLGINYATLQAIRPDLVACEISAYAEEGAYAEIPGRDTLVGALSGWTLDGGDETTGPIWLRMMVGDTATAAAALIGTLLGLYRREREAVGSRVSTSLLRAASTYASEIAVTLRDNALTPLGQVLPGAMGLSAAERLYQVGNGWVAIAGPPDRIDALAKNLQLSTEDLDAAFLRYSVAECLHLLRTFGIPAAAIDPEPERSFFESPAARAAGFVNDYVHAVFGTVSHPFGYWTFGNLSCVRGVPAPTCGQHTIEVLKELGTSEDDVRGLRQSGVILDGNSIGSDGQE